MVSRKLRSRIVCGIVLVFILGLASVSGVVAQSASREALVDRVPVSHTLTGDRGGAFAFYSIDYPGDRHVVTIEVRFEPADPVTLKGVGFTVYAPTGYVIGEGEQKPGAGPGVLQVQYADTNPGIWEVRVHNYVHDLVVSYTVVAQWLPEPPGQSVTGTLMGSSAGAFATYIIDYPGGRRVARMELQFTPADPVTVKGVGFKVYVPSGELVGEGKPKERVGPGILQLKYRDDKPQPLLVQVYNYIPYRQITYTMMVRGLDESSGPLQDPTSMPVDQVKPESTTDTDTWEMVSGSLMGSRAGAFGFHEFYYPGDGSDVEVIMIFTPDNPAMAKAVNFIVYGPYGKVASGTRTSKPTERKATFSSKRAGVYLIQVYNYIDGTTVQYTVDRF